MDKGKFLLLRRDTSSELKLSTLGAVSNVRWYNK